MNDVFVPIEYVLRNKWTNSWKIFIQLVNTLFRAPAMTGRNKGIKQVLFSKIYQKRVHNYPLYMV